MSAAYRSPVEAILFDLDGTLCRHRRSMSDAIEQSFDELGLTQWFSVEDYRTKLDEIGRTESMLYDRFRAFESLAADNDFDEAVGRRIATLYHAKRPPSGVCPSSGAQEILGELASSYPLGIVTNGGPDTQRQKIEAIGVEDLVETVVFGGFDTPPKPRTGPFEAAAERLGVNPANTVFVGDSLRTDIAGGNATGMTTIYVQSDVGDTPTRGEPDETIRSITQLPEILG